MPIKPVIPTIEALTIAHSHFETLKLARVAITDNVMEPVAIRFVVNLAPPQEQTSGTSRAYGESFGPWPRDIFRPFAGKVFARRKLLVAAFNSRRAHVGERALRLQIFVIGALLPGLRFLSDCLFDLKPL